MIFSIVSCNTTGDFIASADLENKKISSIKNISLTKGDVVVLWASYDLNYREEIPSYRIKYHIEQDKNTLLFEEFDLLGDIEYSLKPIIRSSKNTDDNYTNWKFRKEEHLFVVKKDGNYSFDFKLYNESEGFSNNGIKVILHKL